MSLVGKFGGLYFSEISLKFADKTSFPGSFARKLKIKKRLAFVEAKLTQDQVELDGIKGSKEHLQTQAIVFSYCWTVIVMTAVEFLHFNATTLIHVNPPNDKLC